MEPVAAARAASLDAALAHLFRVGRRTPAGGLVEVVDSVIGRWWGASAMVWLADHEQRCLVPLAVPPLDDRARQNIDGTMAGRAYTTGAPVTAADGEGTRLWVRVADAGDRLGVLEVHGGAELADRGGEMQEVADLLGALLAVDKEATDDYFRLRRRKRITLAADMQWSALPPPGGCRGQTTFSGLLEPAYEVAGDTFDHAVNGDLLHAAVFDAVGHDLSSAVICHLVLGSYRHARRLGLDLAETHRHIDRTVATEIGRSRFATGLLVELDLSGGQLRMANFGHPPPLLVRHGKAITLPARPTWPLGLGGADVEVAHYVLEPADRLLLFTDGIVEGRRPDGERFSEATLADLLVKATASELSTAETLRRLIQAVLDHQAGALTDDGTMVLIDWRPG